MKVESEFSTSILAKADFRGETTLVVELGKLHEVLSFCKEQEGFDMLLEVASIDNLETEPRYEIVYELVKTNDDTHLRVKAPVGENESVPTACDLWKSANWLEREVYDLMGITFANHPDLRRIMMWEGYPHHPLRKDFPLAGKPTDLPDVAFSDIAPMAGGPFVTTPGKVSMADREPSAHAES